MAGENMNSILLSVKKHLGSDEYFNPDLIDHINTTFSILTQIGVGPKEGFAIEDETTEWDEFTEDKPTLNMVKTYMYLKTKMYFDASTLSSYVIEMMNQQAKEIESRLNTECDY